MNPDYTCHDVMRKACRRFENQAARLEVENRGLRLDLEGILDQRDGANIGRRMLEAKLRAIKTLMDVGDTGAVNAILTELFGDA